MIAELMKPAQLESRIRWHEELADMFAQHGDEANSRGFRELADTYRDELRRRAPEPSKTCVQCNGNGRLAGDDYCSCRTGRDLRRMEEI
jgi:hypothetical protein